MKSTVLLSLFLACTSICGAQTDDLQASATERAAQLLAEGEPKQAEKTLLPAAKAGDAAAQYALAELYRTNSDTLKRKRTSRFKWVKKAAGQGHADAQSQMGEFYRLGFHLERSSIKVSFKKSLKWHQKAAEQGHPHSQAILGLFYKLGEGGLERSTEKAVYYSKLAAGQGSLLAKQELAYLFFCGNTTLVNGKDATRYVHEMAELGLADYQRFLGSLYIQGREVEKDSAAAAYWYTKAAEQLLPDAMKALIEIYRSGDLFTQNEEKASFWENRLEKQSHRPIRTVVPEYPIKALNESIEGHVTFRFAIAPDGSVTDLEVTDESPAEVFTSAARGAIERFKYKPVIADGHPVKSEGHYYRVTFALKSQPGTYSRIQR